MTDRIVNNLPAASDDDVVRRLFAIELSKTSWLVAVSTPLLDKISRYTVEACNGKGLLEGIERVGTRVGRQMGRAVEMISCYEAGYDGFWLHRLVEARGVRNYVIDPASLQIDRRARGVLRRTRGLSLPDPPDCGVPAPAQSLFTSNRSSEVCPSSCRLAARRHVLASNAKGELSAHEDQTARDVSR